MRKNKLYAQEKKLDTFLGSVDPARWETFRKNLRNKNFAKTVISDPRANDDLTLMAQMAYKHSVSKAPVHRVKGTKGTYSIKYHKDIDRFTCTCPGWVFKKSLKTDGDLDCKHIKRIKSRMGKTKLGMFGLVGRIMLINRKRRKNLIRGQVIIPLDEQIRHANRVIHGTSADKILRYIR